MQKQKTHENGMEWLQFYIMSKKKEHSSHFYTNFKDIDLNFWPMLYCNIPASLDCPINSLRVTLTIENNSYRQ